jgi:hypothetical protein
MTRERSEATWVQEATRDLEDGISGKASIVYDAPISSALSEYPADIVLRAPGREPVAVFFGTGDTKVYEALLLQASARYEAQVACTVVVVLEKDSAVTKKVRLRADNHLVVPRYRGAEREAIGRIVEAAVGVRPALH